MCSAAIQSVMHNIPVIVSACRSSSKNVEPVQNQQVERKEKSATESEGLQDDPAKALSVNEKNLLPVPLVTVSHCIETCTTAGSKTVPTTMINTKISPTSSASHKSCVIIDLTVPEFDDAATSASENTLSLEKISAANSGKNVAVSACVSNGDIKHIDLDKIFNCPSFQEVWKDKDFYKDTLLTATKIPADLQTQMSVRCARSRRSQPCRARAQILAFQSAENANRSRVPESKKSSTSNHEALGGNDRYADKDEDRTKKKDISKQTVRSATAKVDPRSSALGKDTKRATEKQTNANKQRPQSAAENCANLKLKPPGKKHRSLHVTLHNLPKKVADSNATARDSNTSVTDPRSRKDDALPGSSEPHAKKTTDRERSSSHHKARSSYHKVSEVVDEKGRPRPSSENSRSSRHSSKKHSRDGHRSSKKHSRKHRRSSSERSKGSRHPSRERSKDCHRSSSECSLESRHSSKERVENPPIVAKKQLSHDDKYKRSQPRSEGNPSQKGSSNDHHRSPLLKRSPSISKPDHNSKTVKPKSVASDGRPRTKAPSQQSDASLPTRPQRSDEHTHVAKSSDKEVGARVTADFAGRKSLKKSSTKRDHHEVSPPGNGPPSKRHKPSSPERQVTSRGSSKESQDSHDDSRPVDKQFSPTSPSSIVPDESFEKLASAKAAARRTSGEANGADRHSSFQASSENTTEGSKSTPWTSTAKNKAPSASDMVLPDSTSQASSEDIRNQSPAPATSTSHQGRDALSNAREAKSVEFHEILKLLSKSKTFRKVCMQYLAKPKALPEAQADKRQTATSTPVEPSFVVVFDKEPDLSGIGNIDFSSLETGPLSPTTSLPPDDDDDTNPPATSDLTSPPLEPDRTRVATREIVSEPSLARSADCGARPTPSTLASDRPRDPRRRRESQPAVASERQAGGDRPVTGPAAVVEKRRSQKPVDPRLARRLGSHHGQIGLAHERPAAASVVPSAPPGPKEAPSRPEAPDFWSKPKQLAIAKNARQERDSKPMSCPQCLCESKHLEVPDPRLRSGSVQAKRYVNMLVADRRCCFCFWPFDGTLYTVEFIREKQPTTADELAAQELTIAGDCSPVEPQPSPGNGDSVESAGDDVAPDTPLTEPPRPEENLIDPQPAAIADTVQQGGEDSELVTKPGSPRLLPDQKANGDSDAGSPRGQAGQSPEERSDDDIFAERNATSTSEPCSDVATQESATDSALNAPGLEQALVHAPPAPSEAEQAASRFEQVAEEEVSKPSTPGTETTLVVSSTSAISAAENQPVQTSAAAAAATPEIAEAHSKEEVDHADVGAGSRPASPASAAGDVTTRDDVETSSAAEDGVLVIDSSESVGSLTPSVGGASPVVAADDEVADEPPTAGDDDDDILFVPNKPEIIVISDDSDTESSSPVVTRADEATTENLLFTATAKVKQQVSDFLSRNNASPPGQVSSERLSDESSNNASDSETVSSSLAAPAGGPSSSARKVSGLFDLFDYTDSAVAERPSHSAAAAKSKPLMRRRRAGSKASGASKELSSSPHDQANGCPDQEQALRPTSPPNVPPSGSSAAASGGQVPLVVEDDTAAGNCLGRSPPAVAEQRAPRPSSLVPESVQETLPGATSGPSPSPVLLQTPPRKSRPGPECLFSPDSSVGMTSPGKLMIVEESDGEGSTIPAGNERSTASPHSSVTPPNQTQSACVLPPNNLRAPPQRKPEKSPVDVSPNPSFSPQVRLSSSSSSDATNQNLRLSAGVSGRRLDKVVVRPLVLPQRNDRPPLDDGLPVLSHRRKRTRPRFSATDDETSSNLSAEQSSPPSFERSHLSETSDFELPASAAVYPFKKRRLSNSLAGTSRRLNSNAAQLAPEVSGATSGPATPDALSLLRQTFETADGPSGVAGANSPSSPGAPVLSAGVTAGRNELRPKAHFARGCGAEEDPASGRTTRLQDHSLSSTTCALNTTSDVISPSVGGPADVISPSMGGPADRFAEKSPSRALPAAGDLFSSSSEAALCDNKASQESPGSSEAEEGAMHLNDATAHNGFDSPDRPASPVTLVNRNEQEGVNAFASGACFTAAGQAYPWPFPHPSVTQIEAMSCSDDDDDIQRCQTAGFKPVVFLTRLVDDGYVPSCFVKPSPDHSCCSCCLTHCCLSPWISLAPPPAGERTSLGHAQDLFRPSLPVASRP